MEAKAIETTNRASFLTEEDKELLGGIFNTKEEYIEHMRTLWALRAEAVRKCETETPEGVRYDKQTPLFRICELTNKMINALGFNHKNIIFEDDGSYREI